MTKKFEYTDEQGRVTEAEAFIVQDYTTTNSPNSPIMTLPSGQLSSELIPDMGLVHPISDLFVLTEDNIISKKVFLTKIAVSDRMTLTPEGGLAQRNGIDFIYDPIDNSITWENLGLEGYLEVGESIIVMYFYK